FSSFQRINPLLPPYSVCVSYTNRQEGDLLQGFLPKLMIVHQYLVMLLVYVELESDETGLILKGIQRQIPKLTR
ncbi:TPA: hypothetical protein U2B41_001972, partial [Streptococcus suis]|nr:hypothetical protein [Streptococcus suis]HEM6000686.1 hypothetical protein [Streptococcus suis]